MNKVTIGTKFRYGHADANPEWEVRVARGRGTWDCVIVDCPDYAGTKKVFSSEEITRAVGLAKLWQKSGDESDAFFAGLTPGSVVHYSNGFGQFVRSVMTPEKQLLPIALVGNWREFDLPKRQRDGTVQLPFHVQKIQEKSVFRPHASTVYEYNPKHHSRDGVNPLGLQPIDLTVPDLTPEQERVANLWQLVDAARNMLNVNEKDPAVILARLRHLVS